MIMYDVKSAKNILSFKIVYIKISSTYLFTVAKQVFLKLILGLELFQNGS